MPYPLTLYLPLVSETCLYHILEKPWFVPVTLDQSMSKWWTPREFLNYGRVCASHVRKALDCVYASHSKETLGYTCHGPHCCWTVRLCLVTFSEKLCPWAVSDIPGQSRALGGASPCKDALSWAEQLWDGPESATLEDSRLTLRTILVSGVYCKKVTPHCFFFLGWSHGFTFWHLWVLRSSQECKNSCRFCNPIIGGRSTVAPIFPPLVRLESKGIKLSGPSSKVSTWKRLEEHVSILF